MFTFVLSAFILSIRVARVASLRLQPGTLRPFSRPDLTLFAKRIV